MSRRLQAVLVLLLSGAILAGIWTLTSSPGRSGASGQADAAVVAIPRVAGGTPAQASVMPPKLQQGLQTQQQFAAVQMSMPPRWTKPPIGRLVSLLNLETRAGQVPPSAPSESDTAPCGSYATLLPNQIGEEGPNPRLRGYIENAICAGFSRGQQQAQNIALISVSGETLGGVFSVEFESPGWYLITFHLQNPTDQARHPRNKVFLAEGWSWSQILDDTRTLPAHGSVMLPMLVEMRSATDKGIYWYVDAGTSSTHLALQGLTIDKL